MRLASLVLFMAAAPVIALNALKISELRSILEQRGIDCKDCVTKQDFIRAIQSTEDGDFDEDGVADLTTHTHAAPSSPQEVVFSVCTS